MGNSCPGTMRMFQHDFKSRAPVVTKCFKSFFYLASFCLKLTGSLDTEVLHIDYKVLSPRSKVIFTRCSPVKHCTTESE